MPILRLSWFKTFLMLLLFSGLRLSAQCTGGSITGGSGFGGYGGNTFYILPTGGSGTLTVSFNGTGCSWSFQGNPSWLTFSPSSGTGASGTLTVQVTATANTSSSNLTALTNLMVNGSQAGSVTAYENASSCTMTVSPSTISIPSAGGSGSFTVSTTPGGCWFDLPTTSGGSFVTITEVGSGYVFNYSTYQNGSTNPRTEIASFAYPPAPAGQSSPVSVTFTQNGEPSTTNPLPNGVIGAAYSTSVSFQTQYCGTPSSAAGLTWSLNSSAQTATVSGTPSSTGSFTMSANCTFPQVGAEIINYTLTILPACQLQSQGVSPTSLPASGGTVSWTLNATPAASCQIAGALWYGQPSEPYVTVNSAGLTPSSVTLQIIATPNTGTSSRPVMAQVVSQIASGQPGSWGPVTSPTVTQAAATPTCTFSISSSSLTTSSNSIPASGGTATFNIASSPSGCSGGSWSASVSDSSWMSLSATSGSSASTLTATFSANTGTSTKSGTVTVVGQSYPVTEAALIPTLSASPTSLSFGTYVLGSAAPAAQSISVTSTNPSSGMNFTTSPGSDCAWLSLNPNSGTTPVSIMASLSASSAAVGSHSCVITVNASGVSPSPTVTATVTIVAPTLSVSPATLPFGNYTPGTTPSPQTITVSSTNPSSGLSFTASPGSDCAWLNLNPTSGTTPGTVTASVNTNATIQGSHNCVITFSASNVASSSTVSATISNSVKVTTTSLPAGTVGDPYTGQLAAAGGTPPYGNWSVSSGSLPPGLTLAAASGGISGTPTTIGSSSFSVTVQDSAGNTSAPQPFSITIGSGVSITTKSLPNGVVGAPYTATLSAGGGVSPYGNWTIVSGTPPPGLALNASSGVFSGTPSATGAYNFNVAVKDSLGATSPQQAFSITIAAGVAITSTSLPGGTVGAPYSAQLSAAGGTPPYGAWTVSSGGLPPGLMLNSSTGAVSGTPTTGGTYTLSVTVKDSLGNVSAGQPLSISIVAAPTVTSNSLPSGIVGSSYSTTLAGTGGTPPYSKWTVTSGSLPPGLSLAASSGAITGMPSTAAGSPFNFSVQFTDSAGATAAPQALSIAIVSPSFTVTPTQLTINYTPQGASPVSPTVSIFTGSQTLPFTAAASTSGAASGWLSISPSSGTSPATITVSVNPANLAPGQTYSGQITVTVQNSSLMPALIPVSLVIAAVNNTPSLSVAPGQISVALVQGAPAISQQIAVTNSGGGSMSFSATASGGPWLSGGGSGSDGPGQTSGVAFNLDPSQVQPGVYLGSIAVQGAGQTVNVPVTMAVSSQQQSIQLSQGGLQFNAIAQGGSPPSQTFAVLNNGQGTLNWTTQISTYPPGGTWLTVSPSGASNPGSPGLASVSVNSQNLAVGQYYALAQIFSTGAANSPQSLSVVLNVAAATSATTGAQSSDNGLILVGAQGGPNPPGQTISLYNVSGTATSYVSTTSTDTGNWLVPDPATGSLSTTQPASVSIQTNTAGLASGIHLGTLRLAFNDGSVQTIGITAVVVPQSGSIRGLAPAASCSPSTLALQFSEPAPDFQIPAKQAQQIVVKGTDNCGNLLPNNNNASVKVTFSSGEPALQLSPVSAGTQQGTWTPSGNTTGTATLTATGFWSNGSQLLTGLTTVQGTILSASGPSQPNNFKVQNGASYAAGLVAPGTWISLFGDQLATAPDSASNPPTSLGGTQVQLGSAFLPLNYVSASQVNALIPYGLSLNTSQNLTVIRGNVPSVASQITIAGAAPGIFTVNQAGTGQGAIFDGNAVADVNNPASIGDVITIYCTGLGETTNDPSAGTVAPGEPNLATTLTTPSVTIGGIDSVPQYSGLTPGFVGLYQVNAPVPAGVTPGNAVPVIITLGGIPSNTTTIAVQ